MCPPSDGAAPAAASTEPILLLAVDCATVPASVAVVRQEKTLSSRVLEEQAPTDAWVGPAIDACLVDAGCDLGDLDGLAVTVGPGTFTGIRVGIATCLGLAAPGDLPVAGVQTLEAIAETVRERSRSVAACIDARREQVYAALYHLPDEPTLPVPAAWGPAVCSPLELVEAVADLEPTPLVAGNGSRYLDAADGLPLEPWVAPLAPATARLAARTWAGKAPAEWPRPTPLYIRPPDAKPPRNPLLDAKFEPRSRRC